MTIAAIYLRVSLDATGEHLAVDRQREDCRRLASERGWSVVEEYVDNSISASKRTARRPAYDRMVEDFRSGRFGALICWDLDRLTRQPRQLEDWIDAAQDRDLRLITANGEADLSTDGGRLFARIKASVARAEVERKAARQKRAAAQRAEHGKVPAGVRLTGYTVSGEIHKDEVAAVHAIFTQFAAGNSLRGIATWLAQTEIEARSGRAWSPSTVRTILTNPRYAGRAVYRKRETGKAGRWTPIVDDATFDVVQAILHDPRRISNRYGTDRKYLGSGLYLCGVCGARVRSHSGGRYRCPVGGHVIRSGAGVDEYVGAVLREELGRRRVADRLIEPGNEKAAELAAELARLRKRLTKIEEDYDTGLIDGRRYAISTEKVRAELAEVQAAGVRAAGHGVAALLNAPDPVAEFNAASLGVQREALATLLTVALNPAPRGRKFDAATVQITRTDLR